MITILRLGHRPFRDQRITTHCGLVARTFGAERFLYSGQKDDKLENSIKKVTENFGGNFSIEFTKSWKKTMQDFKGKKVHLTMYGLPVQEKISETRKGEDILVIIGGEKVPFEVYKLVDYNISIGNQPHSEVAALAIFLDRYFKGEELNKEFNGKLQVIPQEKGKKVLGKDK